MRESAENYLESILIISKRQDTVRATDICNYFGYSRPTVSIVLKQFRERGLINVDINNHITLTEEGLAVANSVYERHTVVSQMLMSLGVSRETALEDACKIEHDISPETFECIKKHFLRHLSGSAAEKGTAETKDGEDK